MNDDTEYDVHLKDGVKRIAIAFNEAGQWETVRLSIVPKPKNRINVPGTITATYHNGNFFPEDCPDHSLHDIAMKFKQAARNERHKTKIIGHLKSRNFLETPDPWMA